MLEAGGFCQFISILIRRKYQSNLLKENFLCNRAKNTKAPVETRGLTKSEDRKKP